MPSRKKLLFVDDEPSVLAGWRRMLRPFRDRWEGAFVDGGHAALDHIESTPIDVIVADLKMPGMDGDELLRQVTTKHPHVIRIMLSGEPRMEQLRKHGGPAHEYLTKPCAAAKLFDSIEHAIALQADIPRTSDPD